MAGPSNKLVECSHCKGNFQIPAAFANQAVACPHCQAPFFPGPPPVRNDGENRGSQSQEKPSEIVAPPPTDGSQAATIEPPKTTASKTGSKAPDSPTKCPTIDGKQKKSARRKSKNSSTRSRQRLSEEPSPSTVEDDQNPDLFPPGFQAETRKGSNPSTAALPGDSPVDSPGVVAAKSDLSKEPSAGPGFKLKNSKAEPQRKDADSPAEKDLPSPDLGDAKARGLSKWDAQKQDFVKQLPPRFVEAEDGLGPKQILLPSGDKGFIKVESDVAQIDYRGSRVPVRRQLSTSARSSRIIWRMFVFLVCAGLLMAIFFLLI